MSKPNAVVIAARLLDEVREDYITIAGDKGLSFDEERIYILETARSKPEIAEAIQINGSAFKSAVLHQAAIGVSLNPGDKLAYLVKRHGQVVLDISYQGLIRLATEAGSIKWVRAEAIYSKDHFVYRGPSAAPDHQPDILADDRGEFRGVYVVAKTADGDILADVLRASDVANIRRFSKAKSGPWFDFFDEMAKKAAIKRAAKLWPKSGERFNQAVHVLNQHEGGYDADAPEAEATNDELVADESKTPRVEYREADIPDAIKALAEKLIARSMQLGQFDQARDYVKGLERSAQEKQYLADRLENVAREAETVGDPA